MLRCGIVEVSTLTDQAFTSVPTACLQQKTKHRVRGGSNWGVSQPGCLQWSPGFYRGIRGDAEVSTSQEASFASDCRCTPKTFATTVHYGRKHNDEVRNSSYGRSNY